MNWTIKIEWVYFKSHGWDSPSKIYLFGEFSFLEVTIKNKAVCVQSWWVLESCIMQIILETSYLKDFKKSIFSPLWVNV